ncbi:helix-turn-helix transcriptional regulator [Clostridium botulinum]|uniref:Helix-turn-helix domain-containing protein n=1 Tax=Clostridium botulinum TaxID=1491 RepID=A0A0M1LCG0_CLOBO|nr:helix-turn-helix domain-containing protein [Clostridium botulinum]ALT05405.1 Helix-turn-helix XRE-family HipB-like protein [Clostridium botulinum]ALT05503.1 Helix-turn-helix XRE-family HipB-like protein [Clostridium botulinum]ALT05601.1 helix-turn-helix XRE-family HipB-like protein [Clostridium botulinum]ALT05701.1 helix-turn-helix XRE-family HipB-like protein [Clostridium botulinum]ALT05803.1 helix-turn-helix XRE-family HipB-like protein [Clostridium botulinum]
MNSNCPNCDGLLIQGFDSEGLLIYKCTTCNYIVYPNDIENLRNHNNYNWRQNVFDKTKENIITNKDQFIIVSYLKTIRERRKISQKEIAEIFGFTEQRYGNVERHYNAPSIVLISQFAYVLNVSIGELYKPVRVSKEIYDDMKYLMIQKSELVQDENLKIADIELKNAEKELNAISDMLETKCKLEDIKLEPEYKSAHKNYIKKKHLYDKLFSSTSVFLKQGEVVENTYWEKYLKMKNEKDILNFIEEQKI